MKALNKEAASNLWDELRDGFINIEKTIIRIIEVEAWKPLGYETFAEAWNDRMSGVRLAGEARAHVVYFMLSEGEDVDAISTAIGVGAGSVADLRRQKSNGVPPQAATLVRRHRRSLPRAPFRLTVELSQEERERFAEVCKVRDLDMAEEALIAVRAHVTALSAVRS